MPDFLDILARNARKLIDEGYYDSSGKSAAQLISLKEAILKCERAPIISEVKFASPSMGNIRRKPSLKRIIREMEGGGAVGISILTEPKYFNGHISFIAKVRKHVSIPVLMKDIILSQVQIDAAHRAGANAILLIQALFDRGYCEIDIERMIDYSHSKGLEVLLEVHTMEELLSAVRTDADMIGINNRNLKTLEVNLQVTRLLLAKCSDLWGKVIVSESGIRNPEDVRFLHRCGAQAFLVGTSIMEAVSIKEKVSELVKAL